MRRVSALVPSSQCKSDDSEEKTSVTTAYERYRQTTDMLASHRSITITLDASRVDGFAFHSDATVLHVTMAPTSPWTAVIDGLRDIASPSELRECRSLFEDASHPRHFEVVDALVHIHSR